MPRIRKPDIEFSEESMEAYDRLVGLAHDLSSMLTGDPLSPETGECQTSRSRAMTMGMVYFLLRANPDDLYATFFSEKSMNQITRSPTPAIVPPLLSRML